MNTFKGDRYNYCSTKKEDIEKDKFYRLHTFTEEEKKKTKELMDKLDDFILKIYGEDMVEYYHHDTYDSIHYRESLGYISIGNYDRDEVVISSYGENIDTAFFNAIIGFEFLMCENYEWSNRQILKREFYERFSNSDKNIKYCSPFYFVELALKHFRMYYGNNIPEIIMNHYEKYLEEVGLSNFAYDYETNSLVLKTNNKSLIS